MFQVRNWVSLFVILAGVFLLGVLFSNQNDLQRGTRVLKIKDGPVDTETRPQRRHWWWWWWSNKQLTKKVSKNSVNFKLTASGDNSDLAFPFEQSGWSIDNTKTSLHKGDDEFADDWFYEDNEEGNGKIALAMAPGNVIFSGSLTGAFSEYGNQVVVRIVDDQFVETDKAYRYAHLKTLAVNVGDYVHIGSELGTVGDTGIGATHLHSVFYKNILTKESSARSGLENLKLGFSPSASLNFVSPFAAKFTYNGKPYGREQNWPCSTWNGKLTECDNHRLITGQTQDCAYYITTNLCMPRGTSNCRAGITNYCNEADSEDPCHVYDGNLEACDARRLKPGMTVDCAYYVTTNKCRPRGTSNCLAGIKSYCQ